MDTSTNHKMFNFEEICKTVFGDSHIYTLILTLVCTETKIEWRTKMSGENVEFLYEAVLRSL